MLVSQDDFVEVHRDGNFIVSKISKPSAVGFHSVYQQRQHLAERDGNGLPSFTAFGHVDGGLFRGTVDSKMAWIHELASLRLERPPSNGPPLAPRPWLDSRWRFLLFLFYRQGVPCGFDLFLR